MPLFSEDPLVMAWCGVGGWVVLWEDPRGTGAASLGSNEEAYEVAVGGDKEEPFLRSHVPRPGWQ